MPLQFLTIRLVNCWNREPYKPWLLVSTKMESTLERELENLELSSQGSVSSSELDKMSKKQLLLLVYEQDRTPREGETTFVSLHQLLDLQESEEEQKEADQDQKQNADQPMKEKDAVFASLDQLGMSINKMEKLASLGLSKSTLKRKRRQLREFGTIQRRAGSGRRRLIDEEKEQLILSCLEQNPFHTSTKIVRLLENKFEGFSISETTVQRFLTDKGYCWKGPHVRVQNEEAQKTARMEFCNHNKDREWDNVFFSDESSFYLRSPGVSRWVHSSQHNYVVNQKYSKKIHVWGAFSSRGTVKLQFFEKNMDSVKYINLLENSLEEMSLICPDGWVLQ